MVSENSRSSRHGWTATLPQQRGLATIVIPNYNHAAYLAAAIDSVLAQTYPHVEIVVVDDGSLDQSRQVIERYQDKIRPIFQENQGLSAARNSGIRAAHGEFIAVLDADDCYEPTFLETLVPLLNTHPAAAAVTCGYRFVDDRLRPLPQIEGRTVPSGELFKTLARGNFLVPESILVRRSTYEAVGLFDPTLRACEDLDVWLRIARDHTVISSPAVLSRHRVLPGSMSSNPQRMHVNRLKVLQRHLGGADKAGFNSANNRLTLSYAYLTSTIEYLQSGDSQTAYRQFRAGVGTDPRLLRRPGTYYELMLGAQPKGNRGDFATVETAVNYQVATRFIKKLLQDAGSSIHEAVTPAEMWAHLNEAAGLIYYGQNNPRQALHHFAAAIKFRPAFFFHRPLLSRSVKAVLGLKQLKKSLTSRSRVKFT